MHYTPGFRSLSLSLSQPPQFKFHCASDDKIRSTRVLILWVVEAFPQLPLTPPAVDLQLTCLLLQFVALFRPCWMVCSILQQLERVLCLQNRCTSGICDMALIGLSHPLGFSWSRQFKPIFPPILYKRVLGLRWSEFCSSSSTVHCTLVS